MLVIMYIHVNVLLLKGTQGEQGHVHEDEIHF